MRLHGTEKQGVDHLESRKLANRIKLRRACREALIVFGLLPSLALGAGSNVALDGKLGGALTSSSSGAHASFALTPTQANRAGNNAFYSFKQFSIANGDSVSFTGTGISNTLARVTGGQPSNISGTLSVESGNFFLMNPSGVLFGPGAHLDLHGSFAVTTADSIRFSDGVAFASAPGAGDSVLSTKAPVAFGFLSPSPAGISIKGSTKLPVALSVPAGQSFSVVGGPITISHGTISAPGGQVNLLSAGAAGVVQLDTSTLPASPDLSSLPQRGVVSIADGSVIDASGDGISKVVLAGSDISVGNSQVLAQAKGNANSHGISVDASGTFTLTNGSFDASAFGSGSAGDITLNAANANVSSGVLRSDEHGFVTNDADMSLTFDMTYPSDGFVKVFLGTPEGNKVTLIESAGNNGANFTNTTLDDRSTVAINDGVAPFTGIYQPDNNGFGGNGFIGTHSAGTWQFIVQIPDGRVTGTLNSFSLQIGSTVHSYSGPLIPPISLKDPLTIPFQLAAVTVNPVPPSKAGNVNMKVAGTVSVAGDSVLSARAFGDGSNGNVSVGGAITRNGAPGIFISDAGSATSLNSSGRFYSLQQRVRSDGTLGTVVNGVSTSDGTVFTITGPTSTGGTLFESFVQFSLALGDTAAFSPVGAKRIVARVTGGDNSTIDGKINTGGADLYLVNPAGIVFGPSGSLAAVGSFVATTADYLTLSDRSRFSAPASASPPSSSTTVSGYGFSAPTPAAIFFDGASLAAGSTGFLSLVGGDVHIAGNTVQAQANTNPVVQPALFSIQQISLASLGGPGFVPVDLSGPSSIYSGNLTLSDHAVIDAAGKDSSNLVLRGGDVKILDGSRLHTVTTGTGGGIEVMADRLTIDRENSRLFTGLIGYSNGTDPSLQPAKIDVHTNQLQILRRGLIISVAENGAPGANVTVTTGRIDIKGLGPSVPNALPDSDFLQSRAFNGTNITGIQALTLGNALATAKAGNVNVDCSSLDLTQGLIASNTLGLGAGGDVKLTSSGDVTISRAGSPPVSGIYSESANNTIKINNTIAAAQGNSGNVTVTAPSLHLIAGGQVSADSLGAGNAGNVTVMVSGDINVDSKGQRLNTRSFIGAPATLTKSSDNPTGSAGKVFVKAGTIELLNGGQIKSDNNGSGDKGSVKVVVEGALTMNQKDAEATLKPGNQANTGIVAGRALPQGPVGNPPFRGDSGTISVKAGSIEMNDGQIQTTNAASVGVGGDIMINTGELRLNGSASQISAQSTGSGAGGNIVIDTAKLQLMGSSKISAQTSGSGAGGDIRVNSSDVLLQNSTITAGTTGAGIGGKVQVSASTLHLTEMGVISATSNGMADAGVVTIGAENVKLEGLSAIQTFAKNDRNGGDITISAFDLKMFGPSMINSNGSQAGKIKIKSQYLPSLPKKLLVYNGNNSQLPGEPFIEDKSANEKIPSEVFLTSPNNTIAGHLVPVQNVPVPPVARLQAACSNLIGRQFSSLMVGGGGGEPISPANWIPEFDISGGAQNEQTAIDSPEVGQ